MNRLNPSRIVEIGFSRIVEGDMSVFADAEHDNVDFHLFKKGCIPGAFGFRIASGAVDVVYRTEGQLAENGILEERAETLGHVGGKADVFVHVIGVDARPIDVRACAESIKRFVLRRCGGENHVDFRLFFEQRDNDIGGIVSGGVSHFGTGIVNADG